MITNSDMTLYNKINGPDGPTYKRTHIYGVNWQGETKVNVGETGLLSADVVNIFIPFVSKDGYLDPKSYIKVPRNHFTLENGDLIVRGIVPFDLSGKKGESEKDLRRLYDNVYTIISVAANDFGSSKMHHWQVIAK